MFLDILHCPKCKTKRAIHRHNKSAGKVVLTYCSGCGKLVNVLAGKPKAKPGGDGGKE